ncbi:MAG: universal stress protein [Kangiellaceae bacterium]|jgi:universal stress protein A|nr:universal stress protein [Kangiellaceae bacterium]
MYKTIICAIEASQEGKLVLSKAVEIAEKFDSELYVLNVLPYSLLPKDYQKELKEKAIPKFEKIIKPFGLSKKRTTLKVGKPYEMICDMASKKKADLIIMGTHSKRKSLNPLIGSVANGVVNNSPCDVNLIRL